MTMTNEIEFEVGQTVLARVAAPNNKFEWKPAVVKSIDRRYVGKTREAINTREGKELFKGGTLGPLYWVDIIGHALHESPKWGDELEDLTNG